MRLDDMTIGEVKELRALFREKNTPEHPFTVGDSLVIRTVTYHYLGKLEKVVGQWLCLSEASWLADSGRWAEALRTGCVEEVEPYPGPCWVPMGCITDVSPWPHSLPKEAK